MDKYAYLLIALVAVSWVNWGKARECDVVVDKDPDAFSCTKDQAMLGEYELVRIPCSLPFACLGDDCESYSNFIPCRAKVPKCHVDVYTCDRGQVYRNHVMSKTMPGEADCEPVPKNARADVWAARWYNEKIALPDGARCGPKEIGPLKWRNGVDYP